MNKTYQAGVSITVIEINSLEKKLIAGETRITIVSGLEKVHEYINERHYQVCGAVTNQLNSITNKNATVQPNT